MTNAIDYTLYNGFDPKPGECATLTWTQFCRDLTEALADEWPSKPVPNKPRADDMTAIGPYRLREGARRSNMNVKSMAALIALDCDHVPDVGDLVDSLTWLGVASYVHTSPSDPNPDGTRRVRIYVLSEPHSPDQCWRARRALAKLLGVEPDSQTKDPSRILFVGKLSGTPDREWWATEGTPLTLDVLFATVESPEPPSAARAAKPPGEPVTASIDDPRVRAKLDAVVDAVEPYFTRGHKHALALAVGGYLRNRRMPIEAGRYVGQRLCVDRGLSDSPMSRAKDFADPWSMNAPAGAESLRGECPELLDELDTIFADPALVAFGERAEARAAARTARARNGGDFRSASEALAERGNAIDERAERQTELGNARRLVRMHGDRLRCFLAFKTWFIWDGARWAEDTTGAIDRLAKETVESLWAEAIDQPEHMRKAAVAWAAKSQDRSRIANMIALASTEPGVPVTAEMLDSHPMLLNVRNGTLDLQTGELTEPDPALLMTKCCATHYDPEARSDLWEAFVKRTTGGDNELAAYLQRALGYALIGACYEKAFWFGYGPPDGAKSTLLGVIGQVLGEYHVSAEPTTWMVQSNLGGNRGDITRLRGARLVTSLEIRPGQRFDEALVKKVTGGDSLSYSAKYKDEISFAPTFALWMGANDRPTIRDDDDGMWSRMRCVPFTNPVPKHEQDTQLRAKLTSADHAPAVLRWLVEGCLAYQRDGLGECVAVANATREYRDNMNQASGFVDDCLEVTRNPKDEVSNKDMLQAYEQWCLRPPVSGKLSPQLTS